MKNKPLLKQLLSISLIICILAGVIIVSLYRITIDTDIVNFLPRTDPAITDAGYIFKNHPIKDQIAIDLQTTGNDPDILVDGGDFIQAELSKSGLFDSVGLSETGMIFPELMDHIVNNLPSYFTREELNKKIKPLLKPGKVISTLGETYTGLMGLNSIGQSKSISHDPLNFRNIILEKLSHMAPSSNVTIYRGHLLTQDNSHLLIVVRPKGSGTDTAIARKIADVIDRAAKKINKNKKNTFILTPVGAYRAALDNETTAKADTERALLFATIGIALLLIFSFPRPLIGLLSLLPAAAGTATALFVFSLFNTSISILTLGFGGAIISITVDHGIAYLLFIDRPEETSGRTAAREIWSVGLIAALTTVGAFSALLLSGFPILAQIGIFAAMGIGFSFIFVHTVFPLVFPKMPAARRQKALPVKKFINYVSHAGGIYKALAALAFASVMIFFAKPEFNADMNTMNSVSESTIKAEKLVSRTWGNIYSKIYILMEGRSIEEILDEGVRVHGLLHNKMPEKMFSSVYIPSMIFPGKKMARKNFQDWKIFWNKKRVSSLQSVIRKKSENLGFSRDAFEPFFKSISQKKFTYEEVPGSFYKFLGISRNRNTESFQQILTLTPGKSYRAETLYSQFKNSSKIKIFDPQHFSKRLGILLSDTFVKMVLIIGGSVVVLLIFFFLNIRLIIVSLLPITFAMISTLGTMKLLDHPLDIPGLMLSIIVIGMGIDYSLYLVRSYQRYGDEHHPSMGLIRTAVFLASASTLIGFGVMNFADHVLLKSAGLTSLLGIGYSLIGAFMILPPLLKRIYASETAVLPAKPQSMEFSEIRARVMRRYRNMEAYTWMFVRLKIQTDSMFKEIEKYITGPRKIIDIGCGFGIQAAWLLERYPESRITGIDPDSERVRIASRIIGSSGSVSCIKSPGLPEIEGKADHVLMLDMIHYLDKTSALKALKGIKSILKKKGSLIIRTTIPLKKRTPFLRSIEIIKTRISSIDISYRSEKEMADIIKQSGFKIKTIEHSGSNREEKWFIASH